MTNKQIQRIGKGTRRHIYVSAELNAVTDELLADYVEFSGWAESAMWDALVAEHGRATVLEAVEAAQADLDPDEKLPKGRRTKLELTA